MIQGIPPGWAARWGDQQIQGMEWLQSGEACLTAARRSGKRRRRCQTRHAVPTGIAFRLWFLLLYFTFDTLWQYDLVSLPIFGACALVNGSMKLERQADGTDRIGLLIVGVGGAVASTVAAGLEHIRQGAGDRVGLPLAQFNDAGLVPYENIVIAGWDLNPADLAAAAAHHGVLPPPMLSGLNDNLAAISPWAATVNTNFCRNVDGANRIKANSHLGSVEQIRQDIRGFSERTGIKRLVVINLASVESWPEDTAAFGTIARFEQALLDNHPSISPAMLYAYAAIKEGIPYGNFTPSLGADIPALTALAKELGIPVAGKDGKTGQTFLKTVLAPAFRDRALHVDGWFSTNILGNNDGFALDDSGSLASKIQTKGSVLDDILGYKVEDHVCQIHYYRPRGDDKEAWDNIDISGFLGQRMQIKVNFLCKDSILAAPLVIEIARCLDLARNRGAGGAQVQLGLFFKSPMTINGAAAEHDFFRQQQVLTDWLMQPA